MAVTPACRLPHLSLPPRLPSVPQPGLQQLLLLTVCPLGQDQQQQQTTRRQGGRGYAL